ncbi:protein-disulfide reductase DsbD family protein [Vulcaniibacterium thermophilum]|uniref:Thiol:disulfide interchange protein n=3 Tax=Vulcaniibacterium thermophilum TaxID=1169913 RepID=A0A918Z790_9GAMM|nr:thioredoxin family protein [Vulcaniibacterium thermophilum]GHE38901.1 thiol:disulfide interchange protein [Vulcaniibacterium thermophilum]
MRRAFARWVLAAGLLVPAIAGAASPPVRTDHLQSRLVAETTAAVPGTTLTLGLLLEHDPHWHTYWRNPGDSGLATTIALTLPAGVTAEPIAWPHPQRFELSGIVNFGYGGRRLLPVTIAVPADYAAPTLPVRAAANWLICEVECIPGKAEYAFELPVAAKAGIDARWSADFAAARADQPRASTATLALAADADAIALSLRGLQAEAAPPQWQWFPETAEVFANGAAPQWQRTADGWQARWPKSEYFTALPEEVALVAVDGAGSAWRFAASTAGAAASPAAAPGVAIEPLGLLTALLLAFAGGVILNLMPCVFPVLSIKAMAALGSADDRAELRRHGLWYALGIVATFLALAAALLALRAGGEQLGWGFQLQEPRFVAAVALLLFAMALSFSGVWELGGRFMGAGQRLTEGHGARASFFTGALAVVVASPCTAPFMGTALGWALAQPALAALAVFVALGLGLAAPMLLLGFVPALARMLPRSGPWLQGFRQLLAFPLYLTVVWLLWVYGEQTSPLGMARVLAALTALAFALWLIGRRPAMRSRTLRAGAALAAAATALLALALPLSAPPPAAAAVRAATDAGAEPWSERRLAELRAAGTPVLVNMTAAWCITCLANERVALSSDTVRAALAERGVVYLKGDWTRHDEAITRYLQRYGRNGVPLYVLYPPGGGEPRVLPQLLTTDGVADAIRSM